MPRTFDGLRVIDATHVLAGTFAAYRLAVPGAGVIEIDRPDDPGQVRLQGPDRALNASAMGPAYLATAYLAQGGGMRSLAPDLKTEDGRGALLALLGDADVFVQNVRPGALEALGLGYKRSQRSIRGWSTARSRPSDTPARGARRSSATGTSPRYGPRCGRIRRGSGPRS